MVAQDPRFRVLTRGDRSAPARQHTLAAALAWAHDLLGAEEQAVLRRLGVFVGSFSLPAAQAVCRDDGDEAVRFLRRKLAGVT